MNRFVWFLLGLKMYVKQYHWLAKSYQDHILADRLEDELDEYIDEAAELFAVSNEDLSALTAQETLANAKSYIESKEGETMEEMRQNMISIISNIMSFCKVAVEEDNDLKQPLSDYTGRLSNLLLRKLYLLDVQTKK